MAKRPADYFSYLLRLWRTGADTPWKASLEDPHTGERQGFGSLEALFAFLNSLLESVSDTEREITGKLAGE